MSADVSDIPPLFVVRHGETHWNAERRLQGQADTDISPRGREQADGNGRLLGRLVDDAQAFDFVASPLRRTRETMERIRAAMGLDPQAYRVDPILMEVHFGDWQGHTFAELETRDPGCLDRREADKWNFVPPGDSGESYAMLADRVAPFFFGLDKPTICVAHGGVLRAVLVRLGGLDEREVAHMDIPQDRLLAVRNGRVEWLGPDSRSEAG